MTGWPRCQDPALAHAERRLACGGRLVGSCPKCRTELPAGANLCIKCGESRVSRPTVGAPLPSPEACTSEHLAEKILSSREAIEGERTQATVLLAGLKGSMDLRADRDPEGTRRLLATVLEHVTEPAHPYKAHGQLCDV